MKSQFRKRVNRIFRIRLKQLREKAGYSQYSFADAFGVAQSTVGNWEAGKREPNFETMQKLASFFDVSVDYLLGRSDYPHPLPPNARAFDLDLIPFPVIGSIAAGYEGEAIEEYTGETEYISSEILNGHTKDDFFVLDVRGNSMYPEFKEGDRVVVQRCTSVDSDTVAVVMYNGNEATLKKVRYVNGEDWVELIPINPEYAPKRIENMDLAQCRVLGKVIMSIRHY